jgi:hypothetical protein
MKCSTSSLPKAAENSASAIGIIAKKVLGLQIVRGLFRLKNKMSGSGKYLHKRNENLNITPLNTKKQWHKTHANFHFRGQIKIVGNGEGSQKCKKCGKILPLLAFTTHTLRGDGAYYLLKACRECRTEVKAEHREARRTAPPEPENCEKCHENKKLQVDHIHGSTIFRGWLCKDCNTGMGGLGDDLRGVLQAAIYLENDKDKIIELLHKVYGEMFARTNEKK